MNPVSPVGVWLQWAWRETRNTHREGPSVTNKQTKAIPTPAIFLRLILCHDPARLSNASYCQNWDSLAPPRPGPLIRGLVAVVTV